MITAKERCAKSHSVSETTISAEMFLIEKILDKASESGKFSYNFSHLSEAAQSKLDQLGYFVRYVQVGYNEYEYQVSWERYDFS